MTTHIAPGLSPQPGRPLAPRSILHAWSRSRRQPVLTAAVVFVLLSAIWWHASQWYGERLLVEQRAEAVSEVSARGSALSSALSRRMARLQGLHAFVQTEGSEPEFMQKFDQFAADLYAGSSGIRNLAVAPGGEVRYVFPLQGNETVLGYQPALDPRPEIVADVQRAINNSGEVIISGPVELLQGGLGLIARQAVYQDDRYWGLVNVVIDVHPLLAEAGVEGGAGDLEYALRDSQGRAFYGSSSVFANSPIITQIILPEGYWELAAAPRDGWSALIRQPLLISWIGSLVSIGLLTCLVYLTMNHQTQLGKAVEQRTQELSVANALLEQRVKERTIELTTLLNISRSIASTLELEKLLDQVLNKLLPVVDYTGGAILTLEDDAFTAWAYHGLFPQDPTLRRSFSVDNVIGRQLVEEQNAVLIPDVSTNTPLALAFRQATGLRSDRDHYIRSWMGIPLRTRDKVIGMLALHHQEPAKYNQQHADLAMTFANHVAVAIENARLHEKAQRLAVLQERQRLARELHDSVSQALYGIALGTRTAQSLLDRTHMADESKAALSEPLEYVLSLSEGGLAEMRALIFELHPESLEREGLVAVLAKQATVLETRHHIGVTSLLIDEPDASLAIKEALYRVGQEALHNIVKHANATQVGVSLAVDDDESQLILEISDNGKGFDLNGNFAGHLGLWSMRKRVEKVGGTLTITSSSCRGTHLAAAVPLV
jgi:signal transduction histidine kinase